MGGKSDPPQAPDYVSAARETAAGNIAAARQNTAANRVDTFTPYGSLTFSRPGQQLNQTAYQSALDAYNRGQQGGAISSIPNPGLADIRPELAPFLNSDASGFTSSPGAPPNPADFMQGDPDHWQANINLSPNQQYLFNQGENSSMGLASQLPGATAKAENAYANPFSLNGMPAPGQQLNIRPDAPVYDPTKSTNDAYNQLMQRMQPDLDRQQEAERSRLAAMGATSGSEAFNNEQDVLNRSQNDQRLAAALQSYGLGMQQQGMTYDQTAKNNLAYTAAQNQQFQQAQALRRQGISENILQRDRPMDELDRLRQGSQFTMPTFQNFPGQPATSGPNLVDAKSRQYSGAIDAFNVGQAQDAQTMNSIGQIGAMIPFLFM